MDFSKNKHTNIIYDLNAIALAQGGGKRKSLPKKKAKAEWSSRAVLAVASSSKAKPTKKPTVSQGVGTSASSFSGGFKRKPAKTSAAPHGTDARFYEKDGLKIPLYRKGGRKRTQARLSGSLRNNNTEFLLDIVEEYAGVGKRIEFKDADKTKAEMADWIEEHETYALGPNPKSKLTITSKLLHNARVLYENKLTDTVPAVAEEDDFDMQEEEALSADSQLVAEAHNGKGKGKAGVHFAASKEFRGRGKAWTHSSGQNQGTKRKQDTEPEPAQGLKQTTKKLKTRHADEQLAKQSPAGRQKTKVQSKNERRKTRIEEKMAEFSKRVEMPQLLDTKTEQTVGEEAKAKADELEAHNDRLESIMGDLGMHPDNAYTLSMVVHLPEQGEDRVLTAVKNPFTKKYTLYNTAVPHERGLARPSQAQPFEQPFLKDGKHGRGGDFENDPDCRTGRGHEMTPEDEAAHEEYLSFRGQVLKKYPRYPDVDSGEEVDPVVKQARDEFEIWHNNFTYKYPGLIVNHLWPCSCEKLRGESEDEESEEE
jgi:hypothetical protein